MPDDSFADFMARLRAGDPDAATRVFDRFARRLIELARARLDARLRRKVDPEDVLQSALKSFFVRQADRPYELTNWDGLWGLLACITARKCGRHLEHFRAARRDVGREADPRPASDASGTDWEALARDPTPFEGAALAETVEELHRGLTERDRQILALSLHGYAVPEVSAEVGCTERTVYRVLGHIRERLEALRDGPEKTS
jgi:DNA-directed RNA polymerase specialized sigma24 family protein